MFNFDIELVFSVFILKLILQVYTYYHINQENQYMVYYKKHLKILKIFYLLSF